VSLVVSLRIPDGVVIAADSLSTLQGHLAVKTHMQAKCPKCKEDLTFGNPPALQMPVPLSTSSFAQKLFPLCSRFGVGAYGWSLLSNRTVGYYIETLNNEIKSKEIAGVTDAAQLILDKFDRLIHDCISDIGNAPEDYFPMGFHVAGYDDSEGKTIEVKIGKNSRLESINELGCAVSGSGNVVAKLWELGEENESHKANFGIFSLQDAIDYADFLISATASYQRFAQMIPNVGGEVDIALVTQYQGFTWIRQKKLARILLGKDGNADE